MFYLYKDRLVNKVGIYTVGRYVCRADSEPVYISLPKAYYHNQLLDKHAHVACSAISMATPIQAYL